MNQSCRFAVAVHICCLLALYPDRPATSAWLAGSVNTNPVVVRRLLAALNRAGIVRTQRGSGGGSFLARMPGSIALIEIERAVDEDEGPGLHRHPPNPHCPVGAVIVPVLSEILGRARQARERELAGITLGEVIQAVTAAAGP